MKNVLVVCCIAVLSFSLPTFAVETIMTQEAKQQALDSLAVYEQQQITKLSTQSDQIPTNSIQCAGDSCPKVTQQQPMQSDEVFDESKPMVHKVTVYFINDALFLSDYGYLSEVFFSLKGEELSLFKQTVLYHYLGYKADDLKAQLIVTTDEYVGIRVYITHAELQVLSESDTRIVDIYHKGNSGSTEMTQ